MREVAAPKFVGTFEEINFRTYVIKNGIPGIYMFSVETDKLVVKWLFRMFSGIPYTKADIKRYGKKIISSHLSKGFSIDFEYESQTPLAKTPLDWWLTERHGLYELISGLWHRYDIHHKPWPLKSCKVKINDVQYHTDHFATDTKPPSVMHYSPSIDVLLWARKEVDNESKS